MEKAAPQALTSRNTPARKRGWRSEKPNARLAARAAHFALLSHDIATIPKDDKQATGANDLRRIIRLSSIGVNIYTALLFSITLSTGLPVM